MPNYQPYTSLLPIVSKVSVPFALPANSQFKSVIYREFDIEKGQVKKFPPLNSPFITLEISNSFDAKEYQHGRWAVANTRNAQHLVGFVGMLLCRPARARPNLLDGVRENARAFKELHRQLNAALKDTFLYPHVPPYSMAYPSINVFKHQQKECVFRHYRNRDSFILTRDEDYNLGTIPSANVAHAFVKLLLSIKEQYWYAEKGFYRRPIPTTTGNFDDMPTGEQRDTLFSPWFYSAPINSEEAISAVWELIKFSADKLKISCDRELNGIKDPINHATIEVRTAALIAHLCDLISNNIDTNISFNELVERIAELAKYPAAYIMGASFLGSNLRDVKLLANMEALKEAREALVEYNGKARGLRNSVFEDQKGLPLEMQDMITAHVLNYPSNPFRDIYFRVARVSGALIGKDFIRLEKAVVPGMRDPDAPTTAPADTPAQSTDMNNINNLRDLLAIRGTAWRMPEHA